MTSNFLQVIGGAIWGLWNVRQPELWKQHGSEYFGLQFIVLSVSCLSISSMETHILPQKPLAAHCNKSWSRLERSSLPLLLQEIVWARKKTRIKQRECWGDIRNLQFAKTFEASIALKARAINCPVEVFFITFWVTQSSPISSLNTPLRP